MPPPNRSASTRATDDPDLDAVQASEAASVEVPTPPEPPSSTVTRPVPWLPGPANTVDSQARPSGSTITSAPNGIDHNAAAPTSRPTRNTRSRRGRASAATSAAASTPTNTVEAVCHRPPSSLGSHRAGR